MEDDRADQLNSERFHAQCSSCTFPDCCISFGKDIVKGLALCKSFLEFFCLGTQLLVTEFHHRRAKILDLVHKRIDPLDCPLAVCAE